MDIFIIFGILGIVWGAYNQFRMTRYDGVMHLQDDIDGRKVFFLDLEDDPSVLEHKNRIIFKVDRKD